MASRLTALPMPYFGSYGINRQSEAADLDHRWARYCVNGVVDQAGRLAARQGWKDASGLVGTETFVQLHEYVQSASVKRLIAATDTKLYSGTFNSDGSVTLTDRTGTLSPISGNWQFQNFNGKVVGFQRGYNPIVWDAGAEAFTAIVPVTGTVPMGNAVVSAFGRLWAQDSDSVLKWCDLLDHTRWAGGSAGAADLSKYWDNDRITALAAFAGRLVVFGSQNILVLVGPQDPLTMMLEDRIVGVGCIARDSVQSFGDDLLFLSHRGVESLRRVVDQRTLPVAVVSRHVNDLLQTYNRIALESSVRSALQTRDGFLLIRFAPNEILCFDLKFPVEGGYLRATVWMGNPFYGIAFASNGELYFGLSGHIGRYDGYLDGGNTYSFAVESGWIAFGALRDYIKIVKSITVHAAAGRSYNLAAALDYDYLNRPGSSGILTFSVNLGAQYNIDEWGIGEFSTSVAAAQARSAIGGGGRTVRVRLQQTVDNAMLAFEGITLHAKIGSLQ